ncbi:Hypothetical predicted protein [Cloeon dipterum]|uniref:Uncharacterized protein n=1 Tax=Cloeon dipterum TaxID=197152 RepID=A0A8S1DX11_9INSE|nr:Hypothetical predicted protein [Cloeon dipterum]
MQSEKLKFMVLVSIKGVVSLKKVDNTASLPTFDDVVKNKVGHDSLVVFVGDSSALFSALNKTKNDCRKISRYKSKLITILGSRKAQQSHVCQTTVKAPLEVHPPIVGSSCTPTPRSLTPSEVPVVATPIASGGQLVAASDSINDAIFDVPLLPLVMGIFEKVPIENR